MVENIKTLTRPLLTAAVVGVWAALVWTGRADTKDFVLMASMVAAFWFGGRTDASK